MVAEKQKKRVIRINCSGDVNPSCEPWNYTSDYPKLYFGFCGKDLTIKDKDRYKQQITQLHPCREILAAHIYGQVAIKESRKVKIDTDAFRIIITALRRGGLSVEETRKRLFSAKRVMNLIENFAGWENSTISTVVHTAVRNDSFNSFLFTGPKEYVRYPQMLSLVTLIFRASFNGLQLKTESLDEFIDGVISTETDTGYVSEVDVNRGSLVNDILYLKEVMPHLKGLLAAFYKVFEGKYENYYPKDNNEFVGYGGITALIRCETGNAPLHKRLHHHVFNAAKGQ